MTKGKQVYVEWRLATKEWEAQDGSKRKSTEIVANEVIFLGGGQARSEDLNIPEDLGASSEKQEETQPKRQAKKTDDTDPADGQPKEGEDIPF